VNLRLHIRYQNSAGQRVRIVLNLKQVPYEYVAIPSLTSASYRKRNPQGPMPALEIDGRIVAQSMAIVGVYQASPLVRSN
jgi:maleylpyruvate isomerase